MTRTRRIVMTGLAAALLTACGGKAHRYSNGLLALGTRVAAKNACSCLFVAGQSESHCREWVRVSPDLAGFRVDWERKEVRARAIGVLAPHTARFQGEGLGCTLVD